MKVLFLKYKALIMYGIFGVLTTAVNIVTYWLCYDVLHLPNVPSNILAWVTAVAFAFVTNKRFVFESKQNSWNGVLKEAALFVGARVGTGTLDTAIMFVGVDLLKGNSLVFKLFANVLVIILNFVLSKLIVFKQKKA